MTGGDGAGDEDGVVREDGVVMVPKASDAWVKLIVIAAEAIEVVD